MSEKLEMDGQIITIKLLRVNYFSKKADKLKCFLRGLNTTW